MNCERCGYEPITTKKGKLVDKHDCDYVLKIDSLIAEAEQATEKSMGYKQLSYCCSYFNHGGREVARVRKVLVCHCQDCEPQAVFHRHMNYKAALQGLRRHLPERD